MRRISSKHQHHPPRNESGCSARPLPAGESETRLAVTDGVDNGTGPISRADPAARGPTGVSA
jgi:hypothetical protein